MASSFGAIPGGVPNSGPPEQQGQGAGLSSLYGAQGGGGVAGNDQVQRLTESVRKAQMALLELAQSIPQMAPIVQEMNGRLMSEVAKIGASLPEQQGGTPAPPTGTGMGPLG